MFLPPSDEEEEEEDDVCESAGDGYQMDLLSSLF